VDNENRLNNIDNELIELETFFALEAMFISIDNILESLHDIRRDAKTGRCNEKGLNPEFLVENLRTIESNRNGIVPIFASWEHQKYYNFEMCTIAVHKNDIWITMRIPVVNQGEQLVRTIPTSSQTWMLLDTLEIGLETALFKYKMTDSFMLVTKNNLETCSKLGTSRVCNIRKTKFREAYLYSVPLDIGHGRILLLSNHSAESDVRSSCVGETNMLLVQGHTILKIPEKCALVAKSFEIAKSANMSDIMNEIKLERVDKVVMRRVEFKNKTIFTFTNDQKHEVTKEDEFKANNNMTRSYLDNISISSASSALGTAMISTSSVTLLAILIIALFVILKCVKKCKGNNGSNPVVVVVDESKNSNKKLLRDKECDDFASPELPKDIDVTENDKAKNDSDKLENLLRKPAFQTKRDL